ncbi:MAG: DUF5343 domain-containing protein [Dehalococcoidia bacterium]|nr:DUF5343 domain-containing protein [Dehalococcoidia bacterium]
MSLPQNGFCPVAFIVGINLQWVMMLSNPSKKLLPPYVSYRTFLNFIEGLEQTIPARIDRSYWGERLSGSTGAQLVAALRFLDLVDVSGFPTLKLRQLVGSREDQRAEILKQITLESYSFFFESQVDPQSATYAQMEEAFHDNYQIANDVARKCIKFFIGLAGNSGMKISPFVTKKNRTSRPTASAKKSSKIQTKNAGTEIPISSATVPNGISLDKLLIDKFPGFDPSWPDDVKIKWFAAFDELLKRTGGG